MKLWKTTSRFALVLSLLLLATSCADEGGGDDGGLVTADPSDSEAPLSDLDALLEGAPDPSKLPDEAKSDAVFPKTFDLVALQSTVKSQGSRGVCSIFSTAALMEHLYIKEGTLSQPDFSEQFLQWSVKVEVGAFKTTSGSNASRNLEAIRRFGVVDEQTMPYQPQPWGKSDDERCDGDNQPTICHTNGDPSDEIKASKRWKLPRSRFVSAKRQNIKAFMFQNETAVVAGMTFFYQSWNHRRSKLPTNRDYWSEGYVLPPNAKDREISLEKRAGHSILLVGWDDNLEVGVIDEEGKPVLDDNGEQKMEKGFFLFKNSWGTSGFGIRNPHGAGYGWIAMSYIEEFASVNSADVPRLDLDDEICDDGADNNFDRQTDCDDPQCAAHPACKPAGLEFQNATPTPVPDNDPAGITSEIEVDEQGFATEVTVTVDIEHSFQGDLQVTLVSPDGREALLHDKTGSSANDLKATFTPQALVGAQLQGTWRLKVSDHASSDKGTLNSWSLKFESTTEPLVEVCDDGDDNVGNGLTDCQDPSCSGHASCEDAGGRLSGENTSSTPIPDNDQAGISSEIEITANGTVDTLDVLVSITHTFRGDLTVTLTHPDGTTAVLHKEEGGSADDLIQVFAVEDFQGKPAKGIWTLHVSDNFRDDTGTLNNWSVDINGR